MKEQQIDKNGNGVEYCGNCDLPRTVRQWIVDKCKCGDDEIDMIQLENDWLDEEMKELEFNPH